MRVRLCEYDWVKNGQATPCPTWTALVYEVSKRPACREHLFELRIQADEHPIPRAIKFASDLAPTVSTPPSTVDV